MMHYPLITLLLIIVNVIVSYRGFKNREFFERYLFEIDQILIHKDSKRLITSGFLHLNWTHLVMNMLGLYFFGSGLETYLGPLLYLLIYFSSLIGGGLLSLLLHKNEADYTAVGASGAVCGVMFASIALFRNIHIGFLFSLPGWLYGLLYVLYCIYGIQSRRDNIGHDAHLGGALIGMLTAILVRPSAFTENYGPILIITIPCLVFFYILVKKPGMMLLGVNYFKEPDVEHNKQYTIEDRYNTERLNKQQQIDNILEKIHKKGIKSLNKKEKEMLDEYSKSAR